MGVSLRCSKATGAVIPTRLRPIQSRRERAFHYTHPEKKFITFCFLFLFLWLLYHPKVTWNESAREGMDCVVVLGSVLLQPAVLAIALSHSSLPSSPFLANVTATTAATATATATAAAIELPLASGCTATRDSNHLRQQ